MKKVVVVVGVDVDIYSMLVGFTALCFLIATGCLIADILGYIDLSEKAAKDACVLTVASVIQLMVVVTAKVLNR